ncbi:hypothetical protein, partial [Yersinia ruckeri]|uniref:hypothetical protein n=1 Tax=Yersinia ruckeri TaxID=29486 RepID=UPI001C30F6CF
VNDKVLAAVKTGRDRRIAVCQQSDHFSGSLLLTLSLDNHRATIWLTVGYSVLMIANLSISLFGLLTTIVCLSCPAYLKPDPLQTSEISTMNIIMQNRVSAVFLP